jgi:hypothetical protein
MSEFVEVKTAELIGAALDWAVAQIEGVKFIRHYLSVSDFRGPVPVYTSLHNYRPSTDWSHGGPLIDKHQLDLKFERKGLMYAYQCQDDGLPIIVTEDAFGSYGLTHLIAACRAIVHAKLGGTVLVPGELVK